MPVARRYNKKRWSAAAKAKYKKGIAAKRRKKSGYSKYASRYSGVGVPRRQTIKRQVVSTLNNIAENHFISTKITSVVPVALAFNPSNFKIDFNLGSSRLVGTSPILPVGGALLQFNLGQSSVPPLEGKYAYVKQSTLRFQIRMLALNESTSTSLNLQPIHFRVLILANRARLNTLNVTPPLNCFLDYGNNVNGYDSTSVIDNMSIKTNLVNTQDFVVLRDNQFTLSPSGYTAESATGAGVPTHNSMMQLQYPNSKMFRHTTQVNKKCEYDPTALNGRPFNYADDNFICVLATCPSVGSLADQWILDLQNTTTYNDL